MIEYRMTVYMTESEVARDLHTVLEKIRQGVEVVIEQDSRPVAILKAPMVKGRKISEVIARSKPAARMRSLTKTLLGT